MRLCRVPHFFILRRYWPTWYLDDKWSFYVSKMYFCKQYRIEEENDNKIFTHHHRKIATKDGIRNRGRKLKQLTEDCSVDYFLSEEFFFWKLIDINIYLYLPNIIQYFFSCSCFDSKDISDFYKVSLDSFYSLTGVGKTSGGHRDIFTWTKIELQ